MTSSLRTFVLAGLFLTAVLMPGAAQAACTVAPGPDACLDSSTCNTVTGRCDPKTNVPLGGSCVAEEQCASGFCNDRGRCVATEAEAAIPIWEDNCGRDGGLVSLLPSDICTLEDVLATVIDLIVQVGTILLVLMLVVTGFKFVAAQGNAEEIKSARDSLTWVIIGGLLLLGAEALSLVIKATVQTL